MTAIAFHTGIDDPVAYACRLLRKALRQGRRVVVCAEAATLDLLDKALWTFDPQDFVPHLRLRPGQRAGAVLERTPIWLVEPGAETEAPGHEQAVWVRLGPLPALQEPAAERVVEIIGLDDDERRQARQRWRAYETAGFEVQHLAPTAR